LAEVSGQHALLPIASPSFIACFLGLPGEDKNKARCVQGTGG